MSGPHNAESVEPSPETFDRIAEDLHALREEAGGVSYAEIVRRIARRRIEAGQDPVRARPARTTVYDTFRPGRARMNAELVHDIVLALGADEAEARDWRRRVARARKADGAPKVLSPDRGPQASVPESPMPTSLMPESVDAPLSPKTDRTPYEAPVVPERSETVAVDREAQPPNGRSLSSGPRHWALLALVVLGGVVVNEVGSRLNGALHVPLYLDMLGTGLVAMGFGLWPGAAVAVLYSGCHWVRNGFAPEPFLLVTLTGAVLWSVGIRRWGMGRSIGRYFLLQILVAVCCTLVAVPINIFVLHGHAGHALDAVTSEFTAAGFGLDTALFLTNISTSVADKLITGFVSLVGLQALQARGLIRVPTPPADDLLRALRAARERIDRAVVRGRRPQG